ncbi:hypothetical protein CT0861_04519 [Colletotrichum tofieldiae]|uniref:Uncharacterized protein n=1 Tax=Colletotrichum tofieldiae TaxID=708197 RepID=A0A166RUC6_9PEZI|nr:hypothetical protein CT0861_04519 [Colletotrichum tofieldiae]
MLRPASQFPLRCLAPGLIVPASLPNAPVFAARQTTKSPPARTENPQYTPRDQTHTTPADESSAPLQKKKKTMAELDEELRLKLEGMSGEGGAAGVEYENGRAEGLKRGVKSNMFRVI